MCRCFTACLLLCLLLTQTGRAQLVSSVTIGIGPAADDDSEEENPDLMQSIAADGEHRVWAIFRSQGTRLALLKDGRWSVVKPDRFPPTLRALQLATLSDGSIACLWRDEVGEDVHVLSRHTPEAHEIIISGPARLLQPRLLPLAAGGMVVTAAGRELLYIPKAGAPPEHITLEEKLFLPPKKNNDGSQRNEHLPLHAVQDARGTVWLWSPAMRPVDWEWRLRGVGRLADKHLHPLKFPGATPEQPISVVAPWKDGCLAIAVAGTGWFDFDDEKHQVTAFQGAGDEMKYVERIFTAHKEWFFITTPRPSETKVEFSSTFMGQIFIAEERFYDPLKRTTALFSLDGITLEPRTWKLDDEPLNDGTDRPVVEARDGFWTCVDGGLAFVPYDPKEKVKRIDWRHGLDLVRPTQLAQSGDSTLVVLDRSVGEVRMLPLHQPPPEPSALRLDLLNTGSLLLEDSYGHVWGRMADGTFQCWENGRWQVLKVPEKVTQMEGHAFLADSHGQGWLLPLGDGPSAVFDFTTREWQVFDSQQAALTSKMFAGDKLKLRDHPVFAPVSSSGTPCQIGFLRRTGSLHHFDGYEWRQWTVTDFAGPDANVTSPMYFDAHQQLTVRISSSLWKLSPEHKWQHTEEQSERDENIYRSEDPTPPPGCPITKVTSTAYDRHGVCWFSDSKRKLWKSIPGCAVPVLQPGEPDPFPRGMHLYEVRSDLDGNAFLRLKYGWRGDLYLTVRSRLPLPQSAVTLKEVLADTARLTFGAAPWHTWRIDGGPWSLATDQKERTLTGLLPGAHKVEVMAYNADLTPAKASAKLKLTTDAANIPELDTLIQKLGGDDLDASEAAARRLRSQGRSILPGLIKAREKANDRTRWWLDAIIQHIQAQPQGQ